ncbi:MAG TPA: tyrosine-type recombinase/integrase [Bacillales bacterium]|nr:tyrosine-type recombinase/integrase [Bacillales bacterium]
MDFLQHTYATFLIRNGANAKLVQHRLGHESVDITLKYYAHLWPNAQLEEVQKLEDELLKHKSKLEEGFKM